MNLGLKGKRALVTGSSSGLGAAAAEALAVEEAEVAINSRNRERLEAAGKKIKEATGFEPSIITGDVSKPDDVKNIIASAGQLDILVCNAGGPPPGQFVDHLEERWRESADLTLFSAINLTRAVIDGMRERRFGRVIFITSIGVLQPVDGLILSNTFRAGVTGFCKTLSNNYAGDGVTFNCVCPGYTATERLQSLAENMAEQSGKTSEEIISGFAAMIPAGRVGQPEELAALITFLASEKAAFITGASIPVDGGHHRGLL
ncbi:MAG: SDR family oxidoreductase [candidate division Zixibacteria bacterium]|nr:SDR family oxidoreductase [candidate division Zixibacteria bacterium]